LIRRQITVHNAIALLLLCAGGSFGVSAEPATPNLSITIAPQQQSFHEVKEIVLNVEIHNLSDQEISFATIDKDPPLRLRIYDEQGRTRVVDGPEAHIKNGRTRNRIFTIKAQESVPYETSADALLGRGESFANLGPGELRLQVVVPRVTLDKGQYHVELIKSNMIKVVVEH